MTGLNNMTTNMTPAMIAIQKELSKIGKNVRVERFETSRGYSVTLTTWNFELANMHVKLPENTTRETTWFVRDIRDARKCVEQFNCVYYTEAEKMTMITMPEMWYNYAEDCTEEELQERAYNWLDYTYTREQFYKECAELAAQL
jgi:hypothetical protein